MTPVVMADRLLMPAFSSPGTVGPNGTFGEDQARSVLVSDQERSSGFVVAQASPGGAAAPTSTVDGPAVEVISASRSNLNGRDTAIGESVVKYLKALHENGRRVTERVTGRAPALPEPAVKLVVATEPGPAAAALAPPGLQPGQEAVNDSFQANLNAVKEVLDFGITVGLVGRAVAAGNETIKRLTEMG
jgi:hypothetical protein